MDNKESRGADTRVKGDRNLDFSYLNEDDQQQIGSYSKKRQQRDPLSHRIIEKRRRDRMNKCLTDLSCIIPQHYKNKGRGRIEKTEIIEMSVKYIRHLQEAAASCTYSSSDLELNNGSLEPFQLGFQECIRKAAQFLVDQEGLFPDDSICVRLTNHLTKHFEKVLFTDEGFAGRHSSGASSSSSGYHANSSSSSSDVNVTNFDDIFKDQTTTEESAYRSEGSRSLSDFGETQSSVNCANGPFKPVFSGLSSVNVCFSTSSSSGSNNSSSGSSDDNSSRLYKFKSNIKQRFNVDLENSHKMLKRRRGSESSCGNVTDKEKGGITPSCISSVPCSYMLSCKSSNFLSNLEPCKPSLMAEVFKDPVSTSSLVCSCVPIFALHKTGSFYVPLTIDQTLIAPLMARLADTASALHPISIYASFGTSSGVPSPKCSAHVHFPANLQVMSAGSDGGQAVES